MSILDKIKIWFQIWAPKHAITRLIGLLASAKLGNFTTVIIKIFIKQYKINMDEALHSEPTHYKTFNDFFTRELKEGSRTVLEDKSIITYPADACVSQFGSIEEGQIIQAKAHYFSAQELLGGDADLYEAFKDGQFATLYLSPSDYHRVHMPCDGILRKMIYVPGDLYSVNPLTAENIPNLFARNERVVCIFDTDFGPMAQILVGATIVGSIELIWAGTVTPPRGNTIYNWDYPAEGSASVALKKGDEMGRFKLGSTVINLFAQDTIEFDEAMTNKATTRLGAAYARIK